MNILEFLGGVWAAVLIGILLIAMVVSCTYDRHGTESPKWWTFSVVVVFFCAWHWRYREGWDSIQSVLLNRHMWTTVAIYLLIGLGYAVLEAWLDVPKSARYWSEKWEVFKNVVQAERVTKNRQRKQEWDQNNDYWKRKIVDKTLGITGEEPATFVELPPLTEQEIVNMFILHTSDNWRIIIPAATANKSGIEPKVNRKQLAESIGCWTIFWPFYAVSLIIGDLLNEFFHFLADMLVRLSSGYVRRTFANVFKF